MTYIQAIAYMESLRSRGIQPGLSAMQQASERLAHPEAAFRVIHIAGTNGKGSTAAMIAEGLQTSGQTIGLFTSPTVTTVRDTVRINGQPVSEDAFAEAATTVCEATDRLTEFEWLTTVCFVAFRNAAVDVAVIECGLGGGNDATNILPPPLCAVFTPIDLDHTDLLGNTLASIAEEKSGIIKAGCDVVCAPRLHPEALGVLYEAAAANGCRLFQPSEHAALSVDGQPLPLAMPGEHQRQNALTAYTVLERAQAHGIPLNLQEALLRLAAVTLPCRIEWFPGAVPVLLDGAHNAHGVRALCDQLRAVAPVTFILGMLADKDHAAVIEQIAPYCRRILCCTPPRTPRAAMDAEALAAIASRYVADVKAIADPEEALAYAKKAPDTACIAAGGSFYTAAAVRRLLTSTDHPQ